MTRWPFAPASRHSRSLRQRQGSRGERLACDYLRRQGYTILATNVRYPVGELDVVAREDTVLCFVEVRSSASTQFGHPVESITPAKQRRLIRAARWYLQRHPAACADIRFDVVTVVVDSATGTPTIELIRGAFTADDCSEY